MKQGTPAQRRDAARVARSLRSQQPQGWTRREWNHVILAASQNHIMRLARIERTTR